MSEIGEVSWNERLEEYFCSTAEQAECLSWLHKRAEEIYSSRRTLIDLPVIVISSATGFLSVGSSTMFEGYENLASTLLGVASLFVGVLNTAGAYFGWAKRAEGHRISSIHYAKLYRFLKIEMALPRDERMSATDLLKYTKDQYDRLQEISPMVPPQVIADFRVKFEKYADISKPEDANGLVSVVVFQEPPQSLKIRSPLSSATDLDRQGRTPPSPRPTLSKRPSAIKSDPVLQMRPSQQSAAATTFHEQVGLTIVPTNEDAPPRTTAAETHDHPHE